MSDLIWCTFFYFLHLGVLKIHRNMHRVAGQGRTIFLRQCHSLAERGGATVGLLPVIFQASDNGGSKNLSTYVEGVITFAE